MNVKSWLRRNPQPAKLTLDGTTVPIGTGPKRWQEACDTIDAMDGSRLQAHDASGAVLRATTLDRETDDDAPAATSSTSNDLQHLATLLATAWKDGAEVGRRKEDDGFNKLVVVVEIMSTRLAQIETAWQQMLVVQSELYAELAEARASEGEGEGSVMGIIGQAMAERSVKKKLPAANGKASSAKGEA